jgi:hypothetical protein
LLHGAYGRLGVGYRPSGHLPYRKLLTVMVPGLCECRTRTGSIAAAGGLARKKGGKKTGSFT